MHFNQVKQTDKVTDTYTFQTKSETVIQVTSDTAVKVRKYEALTAPQIAALV